LRTVNVNVTIQLDIDGNTDRLIEVQRALDFINQSLARETNMNYDAQILMSGLDNSNIEDMTPCFDIDDEVEVPEPNETDLHNHSFVGTIIDFRGDNAIVEDGDGNTFEIETDRLTFPYN